VADAAGGAFHRAKVPISNRPPYLKDLDYCIEEGGSCRSGPLLRIIIGIEYRQSRKAGVAREDLLAAFIRRGQRRLLASIPRRQRFIR